MSKYIIWIYKKSTTGNGIFFFLFHGQWKSHAGKISKEVIFITKHMYEKIINYFLQK
jgi:hypothetical protein